MEEKKYKYYVTEKNDLGIIWSVFDNFEEAKYIKTEHDGYKWKRENVFEYQYLKISKIPRKFKIQDLKRYAKVDEKAYYSILFNNCHFYGSWIFDVLSEK